MGSPPTRKIVAVVERLALSDDTDEVAYWLSRPVEERIAAVQILRRRVYGDQLDSTSTRTSPTSSTVSLSVTFAT